MLVANQVEMAVACPTDIKDDDERGFTTAGRDHQFDPEAADRGVGTAPRRRKWTLLGGKRRRSGRALSMPIAPADLDLDGIETLKPGDRSYAFRSPAESSEDESSSDTLSTSRSGSGERKRRTRITQADESESESIGSPVSWRFHIIIEKVGRVWFSLKA